LQDLLEMNQLTPGEQPAVGERIYLQRSAPAKPKLAVNNNLGIMTKIRVHDKNFEPYLSAERIAEKIREVAAQLNRDYADKKAFIHCDLEWGVHVCQ
jgi:hypothetical protein